MKKSKFGKLNLSDFWKGLIVAVLMAVATGLYTSVEAGQFPASWNDWKVILLAGVGAGLAYILKNLVTNSQGGIAKKEPPSNYDQI